MSLIRIGHKGADALVPGNTIASFEKAVEIGVDLIEFDVLWLRDGHPKLPPDRRSPLVVAHDWDAAAVAPPPTLAEVLEAFTRPPLDQVVINLDIKLSGREGEVVEAVAGFGLLDRARISTMEIPTLRALKQLEPNLHLGWTVPRVTRNWTKTKWLRPALLAGVAAARLRIPSHVREGMSEMEVESVWAFDGVVSEELVATTKDAGVELNVWTVDDPVRISRLEAMGVSGICSNDPRLLQPDVVGADPS
ncbi:MAG: glycerophosphodiester phosphodiesterase [Solirubrobacterales bacterium]